MGVNKIQGDLDFKGRVVHKFGYAADFEEELGENDFTPKKYADKVFPAPHITSISPNIVDTESTKVITIIGSYLTPNCNVIVENAIVNSITWISQSQININVSFGSSEEFLDLTIISNSGEEIKSEAIRVRVSSWIDLRAGGEVLTDGNAAGNDIRYRAGMTMQRDADGMFFAGSNPWSSWVKFEKYIWNRGDDKTLTFIMKDIYSSMMLGIGSDATDESEAYQYRQAEVEFYFNSATSLWGLYGNNGTVGNSASQSHNVVIASGTVLKLIIESDGDLGDTVSVYQLPSADENDWDDVSNLLGSWAIGGTLNPDEPNIMPFIIPRDVGTQRFIALKIE